MKKIYIFPTFLQNLDSYFIFNYLVNTTCIEYIFALVLAIISISLRKKVNKTFEFFIKIHTAYKIILINNNNLKFIYNKYISLDCIIMLILFHGTVLVAIATGHISGPLDIILDIEFLMITKCLLNSNPQPLESLKSNSV